MRSFDIHAVLEAIGLVAAVGGISVLAAYIVFAIVGFVFDLLALPGKLFRSLKSVTSRVRFFKSK